MRSARYVDIGAALVENMRSNFEQRAYTRRGRAWHRQPRYSMLMGKGAVIDADGSVLWEDPEWMPNALTNDGEADLISVYLKGGAQSAGYYLGLTLVSTATTNRPSATSHASDLTQTALAGTTTVTEQNTGNGYSRQQILQAQWGANSGTQPTTTTAPQKTLGPATTTAWSGTTTSPGQIQDCILVSSASGSSGTLVLFLALSATTTIALGQSFAETLTFKET